MVMCVGVEKLKRKLIVYIFFLVLQLGSEKNKGLLWQLVSDISKAHGHPTIDTGCQTEVARYPTISTLGIFDVRLNMYLYYSSFYTNVI